MPRKKKMINGTSNPRSKKHARGKKGGMAMQYRHSANPQPLIGAAIGAAVGGLVGAAAAVAWADKDTQDKIKTVAGNLRDQAVDKFDEMKHKAADVAEVTKREAKKKLSE